MKNSLEQRSENQRDLTGQAVRGIVLLDSKPQDVWTGRAVINFATGGAGASLYVLSSCVAMLAGAPLVIDIRVRVLSLALVAGGLLAVAQESGRPHRARYLLGNLGRSWMSRESLAAIIFLLIGIVDLVRPAGPLVAIGCAAAFAFIVAQGMIVWQARAVAAWRSRWIPAVFVSSSFTAGAGLMLVTTALGWLAWNKAFITVTVFLAATDLIIWVGYIREGPGRFGGTATAPVRNRSALLSILGLGRFLPMIILLAALLAGDRIYITWAVAVAGVALFAGSWAQKRRIICRCGFVDPVSMQFGFGRFGSERAVSK